MKSSFKIYVKTFKIDDQLKCVLLFLKFRMKGAKMHDALARKRNADDLKIEKMKTVDKYFDKWSKITSRY